MCKYYLLNSSGRHSEILLICKIYCILNPLATMGGAIHTNLSSPVFIPLQLS